MVILKAARLISAEGAQAEIVLDGDFWLRLFFLDTHLARVFVTSGQGPRMPRTWSLSPELSGSDAIDGRERFDLTGFPGAPILAVAETEDSIAIETAYIKVEIRRLPLALTWWFRASPEVNFQLVLQDRQTHAYAYKSKGAGFTHYLARDPAEHYYGFGEKSGNANKHGRRLRMRTTDALGYDASSSDPLYKHIPFYLTVRPDLGGSAVGLFYDNLSHAVFDLGQELSAYHGLYRTFEASDGDLDLYVVFGPLVPDLVKRYTTLTGRTAFPPRWSLSYSGSTMQYTDAPNAQDCLEEFLRLLAFHRIPCQSFHLSSGYTLRGGKRYVFTWDRDRFPDPKKLAASFAQSGIRLVANIKPAMLLDHPQFKEVESFRGFVRDGEDESRPHLAQFWGGTAAYLDFTNLKTSEWWASAVKAQLFDHGIVATWNDNNEFEVWDDDARVALVERSTNEEATGSEHPVPGIETGGRATTIACLRPVQTALMLRASMIAHSEHEPMKRPYLVSRSGGPGMQRYAQTWTGDNRTDWKTLRYNLRMGHGLSLSGIFNFGNDVGGFAGGKPDAELFMRWIEQGIYWPRFTIHSWNDDGSANEPWMYPENLPQVRAQMEWRERLLPLHYTLMWRAHTHHEPVLRPLFYDFPSEAKSFEEHDIFMVGSNLLVAPIVEPSNTARKVWLPQTEGGWYNLRTGEPFASGELKAIQAPLGVAPAFIRAGSILPLGPSPSWAEGPLTLRLFPLQRGQTHIEIYDDDGESVVDRLHPPCLLSVDADWGEGSPCEPDDTGSPSSALDPASISREIALKVSMRGWHRPRWRNLLFENAAGHPIAVTVNGSRDVYSTNISEILSS